MSSLWVVLCAQKVSVNHPNVRETTDPTDMMGKNRKVNEVLHEVPFMIVGQDAGDVPVSRREGLEDVCARVRLKTTKTTKSLHITESNHKRSPVCTHQRGGHGDVEKLSSSALRDRSGEEELVSVLGEERSFVLRKKREREKKRVSVF